MRFKILNSNGQQIDQAGSVKELREKVFPGCIIYEPDVPIWQTAESKFPILVTEKFNLKTLTK